MKLSAMSLPSADPASARMSAFEPGAIWPDTDGVHINAHGGGVLNHDGIYYWFGEFKIGGDAGNRAQVGVSVYTSVDLYNWQNRGIALEVSDDPADDIARNCVIERPKVVYHAKTGQFVMWFHLELLGQNYSAARVGVATAEVPTGPYTFVRSFRPSAGEWPIDADDTDRQPLAADEAKTASLPFRGDNSSGVQKALPYLYRRDFAVGQMSRDMTLFVDDDGAAYHVAASEENATLHVARLTDDFLDTVGEYARVFPGRFHEAPAIFKHAGQYFMFSSDCTGWAPNPARLSVASSVFGPWTELGNPCVGTPEQVATTFDSQSTFVLPIAGRPGAFIFMADRWQPADAIDGRHVWLPVEFDSAGRPMIRWHDRWDLGFFNSR